MVTAHHIYVYKI